MCTDRDYRRWWKSGFCIKRHVQWFSGEACTQFSQIFNIMILLLTSFMCLLQNMIRRGEAVPNGSTGPIIVCTRNDDLQAVLDTIPSDRHEGVVL